MRVRDLPRRDLSQYDEAIAEALTRELVRRGSSFRFRLNQAIMLLEAVENRGLISFDKVGGGKTTVCPFFGRMFGFDRVVILCPATMRHELEGRLIPRLRKEIDFVPPIVVSYSQLQDARFDDILEKANPQLVVADEFHFLKNDNAARTKRFDRFFDGHPDTVLVGTSGTGMRRSVLDFWKVMMITHKGPKCPITRAWKEAQDWSLALDPGVRADERLPPGALMEFTRPGEDAREGFSRRLFDTAGVVGKNSTVDCGASLTFAPRAVAVPFAVEMALEALRNKWILPNGELIVDALDFWRRSRQLAQGFYYVWDWPHGVDQEWLDTRKAWRQAVVRVTKLNRAKLDSELLVRNACIRELDPEYSGNGARLPEASRETVLDAWRSWSQHIHKDEPPTRAVWIDDFLVRASIAWEPTDGDGKKTFGVVWCDSRAVQEKARELMPDGYHVGANEAEKLEPFDPSTPEIHWQRLTREHRRAFVTMAYHYGKNLQRCANSLVTCWSPSGATLEQLTGRMHRSGQLADEVIYEFFQHTEELQRALRRCIEDSIALEKTTGAQRILLGTWIGGRPEPEGDIIHVDDTEEII